MTPLAESANRPDWFRLAAQRVNSLLNRATSAETRLTTAETDIDTLQSGLTAETTARTAADTALDGRLDVLEAQTAYTATTEVHAYNDARKPCSGPDVFRQHDEQIADL